MFTQLIKNFHTRVGVSWRQLPIFLASLGGNSASKPFLLASLGVIQLQVGVNNFSLASVLSGVSVTRVRRRCDMCAPIPVLASMSIFLRMATTALRVFARICTYISLLRDQFKARIDVCSFHFAPTRTVFGRPGRNEFKHVHCRRVPGYSRFESSPIFTSFPTP